MDYELAKQLKDAGFPQYGEGSCYLKDENDIFTDTQEKATEYNEHLIVSYIPTLSELIEACGEDLFIIKRCQSDQWETETRNSWGTCGSTPEEAVARLWLALQKHE